MNIENFLKFAADIIFKDKRFACVSAVNIEIIFGSDADSMRFPVVAAPLTHISLLESSVYMCFHHLCLSLMTSLSLLM